MRESTRVALALTFALVPLGIGGCGAKVVVDGPGEGGGGGAGGSGTGGTGGGAVTCDFQKLDILISVDNSRGMATKQLLLAQAVNELIPTFVNPLCVDESGTPAPIQPGSADEPCPSGTKRMFPPQKDIHIGVLSTSIGGHGSDSCPNLDVNNAQCAPNPNTTNNDKAHLLDRDNPCATGNVQTYQNQGFLAWDPDKKLSPPGETELDNGAGTVGLLPKLRDLVRGTGEIGCGYESQLESVYRFLVDPNPYESITAVDNKAVPSGTDFVLLDQRKQFLRPDSMLVVMMTSDENDCSTKEFGQFFLVNQLRIGNQNFRMPRARKECEVNPQDPCCKSCGQSNGACPIDPSCTDANGGPALYSDIEDDINVRCWDQNVDSGSISFIPSTDIPKPSHRQPLPIAQAMWWKTRFSRISTPMTAMHPYAIHPSCSSRISAACLGKTSRETQTMRLQASKHGTSSASPSSAAPRRGT